MKALGEVLLDKYRWLKSKLIPENTIRRRFYDWGLKRLKRLVRVPLEESLGEIVILEYRVFKGRALPFGSCRRNAYERLLNIFRGAIGKSEARPVTYEEWLAQRHPSEDILYGMQRETREFKYQPRIAVGIINNSLSAGQIQGVLAWQKSIKSLAMQVYHNWKLYLIDAKDMPMPQQEGSPIVNADSIKEILGDKEIDFAGFIYPGDVLKPHCLFKMVQRLNIEKDIDIIYSDHDYLSGDDRPERPFFKPDWSPDLLMGMNYISRFFLAKRERLNEAATPDDNLYGFLLEAARKNWKAAHIPNVLHSLTDYETDRQKEQNTIQNFLKKNSIDAEVLPLAQKGLPRVKYKLSGRQMVSIIVPTAYSRPEIFKRCIDSVVGKTAYDNYEIIIIDNSKGKLDKEIAIPQGTSNIKSRIIRFDEPFNYARINNHGARAAAGEYLLFLNDDTEAINGDWIEAMLEHCQRKEIGIAGAKLLYPDGTVQHGGIFFTGCRDVVARHNFRFAKDDAGKYGFLQAVRNVSAVTGACMMVRRDVFTELGGFDEKLVVECNDSDLCLRALEKGYRIAWTPFARLIHHEAISRVDVYKPLMGDRAYFWKRWQKWLLKGDPYYNPNLSVDKEDYSIKPLK